MKNAACLPVIWILAMNVSAEPGSYDCLIEPSMSVEVGSSIRGVAEDVLVKRGDRVKRGDTLVKLESGVQIAAVELAAARSASTAEIDSRSQSLELASSALTRLEELYKDKNVSRQMLDEASSERAIADSNLRRARENRLIAELELKQASEILDLRTIRSSIDGVVVERFISPGELVTEDRPVVSLATIDPLYVEVILPASEFGLVQQGGRALVRPGDPVGGEFEGEVTIVDNIIDAASGTFGVRIELANEAGDLPAGLNCRVDFLGIAQR